MRRCIIHIGMHKTGSTAIQSYLRHHLRSLDFTYADLAGDTNHSARMFSMFSNRADRYHLNVKKGWRASEIGEYNETTKRALEASILRGGNSTLVISGEDISDIEESGLASLFSFLSPHFNPVEIIAYVRPPRSYIDSDFQQKVKSGSIAINMEKLYPNYRRRFEKFDRVFGRTNVKLSKYNSIAFNNHCVVTDFCLQVGIPVDPTKIVRPNTSLSRGALGLLYIHRLYGSAFSSGPKVLLERHRLISALKKIPGSKAHLSKKLIDQILSINDQDIKWIEWRLGDSLAEEIADDARDQIESISELQTIDPATLNKLKDLVGEDSLSSEDSFSVEAIASLVERLNHKLNHEHPTPKNRS